LIAISLAKVFEFKTLKFGIAFHSSDFFEEIFVRPAKYVQCWGVNPEPFTKIMQDFSLTQIDDLNFIDKRAAFFVPRNSADMTFHRN
jgi:hypothetical protein